MVVINFDDDVYFVASVIKLLTSINVNAACKIAGNLKNKYPDNESIDKLDNKIIYGAYQTLLEAKEWT